MGILLEEENVNWEELGFPKAMTLRDQIVAKAQLKKVRDLISEIASSNLYDEEKWQALLKEIE